MFVKFYYTIGEWSLPTITGQPPPPCSSFTLNSVSERKAALLGGLLSGSGGIDLMVVELSSHSVVCIQYLCGSA